MAAPAYTRLLADEGYRSTRPSAQVWTPDTARAAMDATGVETAILSLSRPGVHVGGLSRGRLVARECNEFGAEVVRDDPRSFGYFAILPLPDVEGAVTEARYALDELSADGVILLSNADGRYLGDPDFDPLMEELDARNAVVFVHPTHLPGHDSQRPSPLVPGVPAHLVDFLLDTTRAAVNMVRNGVMQRYPNMRVILSHAGGFVPFAADRIARVGVFSDPDPTRSSDDVLAILRSFYFDVALSASPWTLEALMAFAGPGRIVYGSDYPAVSIDVVRHFNAELDEFVDSRRHAAGIHRSNALGLFPRFADTSDSGVEYA